MENAISYVLVEVHRERQRQVVVEGHSRTYDDQYINGELCKAAGCYVVSAGQTSEFSNVQGFSAAEADLALSRMSAPPAWPWSEAHWKPRDRRRNLVRAAALIVAEVERLDRAAALPPAEAMALREAAVIADGQ